MVECHIPAYVNAEAAACSINLIVVATVVRPAATVPMVMAALAVASVVTVAMLMSAHFRSIMAIAPVVTIAPEEAVALAMAMATTPPAVIAVCLFDEVFLRTDCGRVRNACRLAGGATHDECPKAEYSCGHQCLELPHDRFPFQFRLQSLPLPKQQ